MGSEDSEKKSSSSNNNNSSSSSSNKKTGRKSLPLTSSASGSQSKKRDRASAGDSILISSSNKKKQTSSSNKKKQQSTAENKSQGNEKSNKLKSSSSSSSPITTATNSTSSVSSIDIHPFARGSVIEVLYQPATPSTSSSKRSNKDEQYQYWWSSDSDEDDENENKDQNKEKEREKDSNLQKLSQTTDIKKAMVLLCDIIDRIPVGPKNNPAGQQYRYYVHYRDFNRRMDQWIPMEKIVSPPSIGNAKARALKKKKKQQQQQQEASFKKQKRKSSSNNTPNQHAASSSSSSLSNAPPKSASAAVPPHSATNATSSTPAPSRAARRRSTSDAAASSNTTSTTTSSGTSLDADTSEPTTQRISRRLRRKSSMQDDNATVVTSNESTSETNRNAMDSATAASSSLTLPTNINIKKDEIVLPTVPTIDKRGANNNNKNNSSTHASNNSSSGTAANTVMVGPHVVATVPAQELDEHEGLDEASLREHEEVTKVKNVATLELGEYRMDTWYFSPLPKELLSERGYLETLYVCEFTFAMFARKSELLRHQRRRHLIPTITSSSSMSNTTDCLQRRHPPGNEIYRNGNLSMFEVDGYEERIYCQNLCYIAKLFLDHKTLYFDVDPFLFYVLCEVDDRGYHPVGYYSKEKYSDVGYNLACILTFPSHQRKGYGRFLIAFSYELSKKEEKVGSPEKPMSDLGQQAYKPYWMSTIIDFLRKNHSNILHDDDAAVSSPQQQQQQQQYLSIMDISKRTSIMAEDVVFTLNQLGLLKIINGVYFIAAEQGLLDRLALKHPVKQPRVDPSKLHWTPFVVNDVKRDKFSIHSKKPSTLDTAAAEAQKKAASTERAVTTK